MGNVMKGVKVVMDDQIYNLFPLSIVIFEKDDVLIVCGGAVEAAPFVMKEIKAISLTWIKSS